METNNFLTSNFAIGFLELVPWGTGVWNAAGLKHSLGDITWRSNAMADEIGFRKNPTISQCLLPSYQFQPTLLQLFPATHHGHRVFVKVCNSAFFRQFNLFDSVLELMLESHEEAKYLLGAHGFKGCMLPRHIRSIQGGEPHTSTKCTLCVSHGTKRKSKKKSCKKKKTFRIVKWVVCLQNFWNSSNRYHTLGWA